MIQRASNIPPAATEPVWQASGNVNATEIVGLLRREGIAATLKRIGEPGSYGSSFYTATIYVPLPQAEEARRILREHGQEQYLIDMEALRGIGVRINPAKVMLWAVGAGVAGAVLFLLANQL